MSFIFIDNDTHDVIDILENRTTRRLFMPVRAIRFKKSTTS